MDTVDIERLKKLHQSSTELIKKQKEAKQMVDKVVGNPFTQSALSTLGAGAVYGLVTAIKSGLHTRGVKKNIQNFIEGLNRSEAYSNKADLEKAQARTYEIARVAPHIFGNPELVQSIIKSKLHTGLSSDDKQNLAMLQAHYSSDSEVSKFMPKMASEKVGEIFAQAVLIKEARISSTKQLAMLSALPVLSAVAFGAANQGMAHIKQKKLKASLEDSFSKALGASDADREPLLSNKDRARQAFNTLAHFAPHVALDHQAARAFMNKIVSYDQGVDAGTIKELSEITKNLSATSSASPFLSGLAVGGSITGAPRILSQGLSDLSGSLASDPYQEGLDKAVAEKLFQQGLDAGGKA